MKGLINKDLLMVKSNLKMLGMVFIAFILMALNDMSNFFFIPAFLSITIMMSTFSYDEYNKTNAFVITLPKGRENAVKAKYLATLLIVLISIILTFSIYFIVGFIKNNVDIEELFVSALGCGVGIILLEAILYPFIFKFGIEKSRIGMFVGVFIIVGIITLIIKSNISIKVPELIVTLFDKCWFIIIPMLIVLILLVSYKISKNIYLKKEF